MVLQEIPEMKRRLTKNIFGALKCRGEARTFNPAVLSHLENVLMFSVKHSEVWYLTCYKCSERKQMKERSSALGV